MLTGAHFWQEKNYILSEKKISEEKTILTYPELPANLYMALQNSASRFPNKIFLIDNFGHETTFSEFLKKVDDFSHYLSVSCSLSRGDHAALMLFNSLEFGVAFLALIKLGVVCVPLPTKYTQTEVHSLMEKSDVRLVICDEHFSDWFSSYKESGTSLIVSTDAANGYGLANYSAKSSSSANTDFPEDSADDPALLVFTSGTTSQSKGVLLRNYNIMHAIASYKLALDFDENEVGIIPIPMYLITGLIAVFGLFLYCGAPVYLHKFFDAKRVIADTKKNGITFIHSSPTVFSMILSEAAAEGYPALPSLKKFACGSSNMPKEKILALHEWLPESHFHTVYGLTETTSPGTIFPTDASVSPYIGSSGVPIPGMNIRIIDEETREEILTPETIGEIWLNGTNILASYYNLNTPLLQDGWLNTGDLGYFNKDGYLYIKDRKKDMINRGGEKITSFDIENEIYLFEGINDAAVVGIPDEVYGEVPAAVVTAKPGYTIDSEELIAYLKTRMAKYKVPVKILILDTMPETPNGKINKKYIRTLFQ